ncbi:MAG: hydrogenase 4 membrane subunit [Armatimonadetes bacterium]|nr:hydrogenase 4 membrane subunit [Armatimonadota bacterium]
MQQPVPFVANIALAMIVTSLIAAEIRALRISAFAYLIQALLLVSIFVAIAFATGSEWLMVWAFVALVTKATLIPWLLFAYIRRTGVATEAPPYIDFAPSVLLACVLMVLFYKLTHVHAEFLAPGPEIATEPYRTTLAVALTIFTLGLYAIVSRRDAIKSVIALCLLENGVHLSLVSLAPGMPEMPIIGIVTEVFVTVWLLLYVISGIQQVFGTTDTAMLRTLRG